MIGTGGATGENVTLKPFEKFEVPIADGLGLQKSVVSSAYNRASQKDLDALNGRSLSDWTFVSALIDGKGFAGHTCVVAMGITLKGGKHILGVREGASENAEIVTDLLNDLRERGLNTSEKALIGLDGSKALAKGVSNIFGERGVIQRAFLSSEAVASTRPSAHACRMGHVGIRRCEERTDKGTGMAAGTE
ncbi:MAG: hypothetical protein GY930_22545 [bacterium]|nr:hypothetical protein [bacterium]